MKITSSAFKNAEMIPEKYTCKGEDINPPLRWENPPVGTKSFALVIDDPDAPGSTWIHWLVKDISKNTREIKENCVPGIQVTNSFEKLDYGGPCPTKGTHRYFFRIYALDIETFEAEESEAFLSNIKKHKIEKAELMGKFSME